MEVFIPWACIWAAQNELSRLFERDRTQSWGGDLEVTSGRNRELWTQSEHVLWNSQKWNWVLSMNFIIHAYTEHYMMKTHQLALRIKWVRTGTLTQRSWSHSNSPLPGTWVLPRTLLPKGYQCKHICTAFHRSNVCLADKLVSSTAPLLSHLPLNCCRRRASE